VHATDERISPALMVDSLRLRQVLSNFVSNAVKFTRQGQIEIRAELVERRDHHEVIRFCVSDTGIGIPENDQKSLFQPFRQPNGDPAQRSGRIRLGLSICQRLATLMGGTVAVASEPGIGTTMTLTLRLRVSDPRLFAPTATVHAISQREPSAGVQLHRPENAAAERASPPLLLVVDHPVNRLILMRQVNMLGYSADLAEGTQAALEMWQSGRFSLVITDCDMTGKGGNDLARKIRSLERLDGRNRTPIIACLADASPGDAENCLADGVDDCLAKPIELGKLAEKLRRWLPMSRPSAPARSAASPIDDGVLAEISAGDDVLARDILMRFHRYNAEDTTLLKAAVHKADVDQVTHASHRIKGASKTVGAVELATICERLEHACRANDWETVALHMDHFLHEVERLDDYIESLEG
jgi:CheY-like chemotaxis protein/HPt (histidine-containing phosphotransfer) domain-containing protein/anti-sigma regulatory factor (Ser/Thr protein kinase)